MRFFEHKTECRGTQCFSSSSLLSSPVTLAMPLPIRAPSHYWIPIVIQEHSPAMHVQQDFPPASLCIMSSDGLGIRALRLLAMCRSLAAVGVLTELVDNADDLAPRREAGIVQLLVSMIRHGGPLERTSAAGLLAWLTRDAETCEQVLRLGGVEDLVVTAKEEH